MDGSAIEAFKEDGYLIVRDAIPPEVLAGCRGDIAAELRSMDISVDDPTTWTSTTVRFNCPSTPSFQLAGLHEPLFEVYDALLGPGRWEAVGCTGSTMPVRFPSPKPPWDPQWHVDGGYRVGLDFRVTVRGHGRALLVIALFSDVGLADAPTELKVGSHHDVPAALAPYGDDGITFLQVPDLLPASTFERPSVFATGRAGDVYVCHPFLLHRATWPNWGDHPRTLTTPRVSLRVPFPLDGRDAFPVEEAILEGLGAPLASTS